MMSMILSAFLLWIICTGGACGGDLFAEQRGHRGDLTGSQDSIPDFPEVSGWQTGDSVEVFTGGNLYNRIDGAADLFLTYSFEELRTSLYHRGDGASVVVELYRFRTPLDAFGMYSQERPSGGSFLKIGAQAYCEDQILNFVAGETYVKISSFGLRAEADTVLREFGRAVAAKVGGTTVLPNALKLFPLQGKKPNSERYASTDLLGYDCFHSGFTSEYRVGKREFQLLLIQGADAEDCREMLARYFRATHDPRKDMREGQYDVSDPHHGVITLCWRGKFIYGVLHLPDRKLRRKYIVLMEGLLKGG